jgi:nucleoside-diphosphate-sugar epimerase
MRVLVAGASGVIGAPLVDLLVAGGYEVTGATRSAGKADALRTAGATPVVVDVFDRAAQQITQARSIASSHGDAADEGRPRDVTTRGRPQPAIQE